jgi:hypothetical protein
MEDEIKIFLLSFNPRLCSDRNVGNPMSAFNVEQLRSYLERNMKAVMEERSRPPFDEWFTIGLYESREAAQKAIQEFFAFYKMRYPNRVAEERGIAARKS